jgi:hypothetical protein
MLHKKMACKPLLEEIPILSLHGRRENETMHFSDSDQISCVPEWPIVPQCTASESLAGGFHPYA